MYLTTPTNHGGYGDAGDPGVGALPVIIGGASLGVAVFSLGRTILTSGSFSNSTSTANYIHQSTPLSQTFRRCAMDFSLRAHHPRYFIDAQIFWYRLAFEYNGNDLRNVTINPLVDKSSTLSASTFSTTWTGQAYSPDSAPVAEIMFQLNGRWDPVGRGDVSFSGELKVNANGVVSLAVQSERNWVTVQQAPVACTRVEAWRPPPTVRMPITNIVLFAPNSAHLVEADERRLMLWLTGLSPAIKASIAAGSSPIRVEGFASTTQGGPANLTLSRQRAERVAKLIRDALGSNTPVNVLARGEYLARTADRVEAAGERRAVITIDYLVSPPPPGGVQGYGAYGRYW